jgi:hypothetical protein
MPPLRYYDALPILKTEVKTQKTTTHAAQFSWPPAFRSAGRHWGFFVATGGEFSWPPLGRSQ